MPSRIPIAKRVSCLLAALACCAIAPAVAQSGADELDQAFDELVAALQATQRQLKADPFYAGERDRIAGIDYWSRMVIRTLEEDMIQDPDFPLFRVVDHRIREGGDNPDQRYLLAPIRGGEHYRISGRIAGEHRLEFQIYAGLPWSPGGGKVVASLSSDELQAAPDGRFSIELAPQRLPGNWMLNPASGTTVMVRQIFSDWAAERAGEIHIDRAGFEGKAKPAPTREDTIRRLARASDNLREVVPLWPMMARERFVRAPANELGPLFDPGGAGGVVGRWMAIARFDLREDEALVLTTWPTAAQYQGVHLTDPWTSSLEYANRQTSLSADQAWRSRDGAFHIVISHRDPGVQNWLDTTGLQQGLLFLRYDGLRGTPIPEQMQPRLRRVRFEDLPEVLPADTPSYSPQQRFDALKSRRGHIQQRFGI